MVTNLQTGELMKTLSNYRLILLCCFVAATFLSCKKSNNNVPQGPYTLSYGDSILYLAPGGNNIIFPTEQRSGVYTGFPDGIEIDDNTGAIDLSKSETGLRYRITHTATDGSITETKVVLSGITFTDHYYLLSSGDSVANPVYNADLNRTLPLSGSSFDDGNTANGGGCKVYTNNGQINLAETVRNGVFGNVPQNDVRKDFDIDYRLNDESGKSLNKIRVRLYYYETMADVPADLLQTLQDRQELGVFLRGGNQSIIETQAPLLGIASRLNKEARPRPPCVIIVDH